MARADTHGNQEEFARGGEKKSVSVINQLSQARKKKSDDLLLKRMGVTKARGIRRLETMYSRVMKRELISAV